MFEIQEAAKYQHCAQQHDIPQKQCKFSKIILSHQSNDFHKSPTSPNLNAVKRASEQSLSLNSKYSLFLANFILPLHKLCNVLRDLQNAN